MLSPASNFSHYIKTIRQNISYFHFISKSKASEVGPAAGTDVKLQEAYASEKTELGTFAAIGYKAPGDGNNDSTSVFYYGAQKATAVANNQAKWEAQTRVGLNDCNKDKKWAVLAEYAPSTGNINIKVGSDDKAHCIEPLTPNFCNLATSGKCEAAMPY